MTLHGVIRYPDFFFHWRVKSVVSHNYLTRYIENPKDFRSPIY